MKRVVLFRLSQLMIILPCMLREWVNFLTDIGQYERITKLSLDIMAYPTKQTVGTLFARATQSVILAKSVAGLWIMIHGLAALLLTFGMLILIRHIKASKRVFNQKKLSCFIGLAFAFSSYVLLLGFGSMDVFLSWMQQIDFNGDITGYGLPIIGAMLYLCTNEKVLHENVGDSA